MASPPDAPAQAAALLRERARALARVPVEPVRSRARDVLEFRLGEERYALDAAAVRDVLPLKHLTALPCTPHFVAGLVNVRGRVVVVIDLKRFLDTRAQGLTDHHNVVLIGREALEVGVLADSVEGVRTIDLDALQPPPAIVDGRNGYIQGIGADRLALLDVETILADERLVVDEEVEL